MCIRDSRSVLGKSRLNQGQLPPADEVAAEVGKPVALMQLEESYKQILSRFPNIHMSGNWKVAPNNFVHAIQEMPVKF